MFQRVVCCYLNDDISWTMLSNGFFWAPTRYGISLGRENYSFNGLKQKGEALKQDGGTQESTSTQQSKDWNGWDKILIGSQAKSKADACSDMQETIYVDDFYHKLKCRKIFAVTS